MSIHALAVLADSTTTTPNRYSGINPTLNSVCVMAVFVIL